MATLVSKLPAFATALAAALAARTNLATPPGGLPAVQVSSGALAPDDTAAEAIFLLDAEGDGDWARVKAAPGGRQEERAMAHAAVWTTRPGGGEPVIVAARNRVFAIADEIADALDTDPTVAATVRNAHIARWEYKQGVMAEVGRWAQLKLIIDYAARL